jgi:hypothetical protein
MRLGEASNDVDLIKALNEAVERRLELRRPWDTQWWNNIALVAGDHYTRWDPLKGDFIQPPPKEPHKVRLVLNHALTVARTELAKLNKGKPVMDVVAKSEDTDDIAAAKVGQQILEGFEWKYKLRKQRKQAYWWMVITGLGAEYVGFDPANDKDGSYEYYIDPATNEPTWNAERRKELDEMVKDGELDKDDVVKEEPLGDIEFKTYSPFQLLPDETAAEWSQLKDLITIDVVDVDVARANWGKPDISPDPNVNTSTIDSSMMFKAGLTGAMGATTESKNAVKVYTWWLVPGVYRGRYLSQGKMIRWCNKNLILESTKTFPYIDCRIPFAFFEHIPNATSIWPESVMTHIRHVNLEMDKTISQLIENKDYMANPMWRVAIQHDLPKDIVAVPGAVIKYRFVPNIPPPEPIPGVPMPQQVESILDGLRTQILDISGQGEISRGNQLPSSVRSGVQVAYMQEEDETRLGPTAENIEDGVSIMSSLALSRVSQFYHTNRIVRLYKRAGEFDVLQFKGADIKGNTDVIALPGSALGKSKTARQSFMLELVQLGIERDPKRIKEVLELGMGEPDDVDKSYAQADRENHAMVQGVTLGGGRKYYGLTEGSVGAEQPAAPVGPVGADMAPPDMMASAAPPEAGGAPPGAEGELTPDISTMMQTPMGPAGGTRSFFEGGAEPQTDEGDINATMAAAIPQATGEHAPSERGKKGPQAIPVFKWHNHKVHLERHYSFMMDEVFEKIAENHPEIVRLFNEHTAMHEQVLAEQRQQELQALQAAKGAPGQQAEGAVSARPEGAPDAAMQGAQAVAGNGAQG